MSKERNIGDKVFSLIHGNIYSYNIMEVIVETSLTASGSYSSIRYKLGFPEHSREIIVAEDDSGVLRWVENCNDEDYFPGEDAVYFDSLIDAQITKAQREVKYEATRLDTHRKMVRSHIAGLRLAKEKLNNLLSEKGQGDE